MTENRTDKIIIGLILGTLAVAILVAVFVLHFK